MFTDRLHDAIVGMQSDLEQELFSKERALALTIDLQEDEDERPGQSRGYRQRSPDD